MTTRVMTFRFPEELAEEIANRAKSSGKDRTAIVVEALTRTFGLPALTAPSVTTEALQHQLNQVEEQLAEISSQLAKFQQANLVDETALQRITALEQTIASFQLPAVRTATEEAISTLGAGADVSAVVRISQQQLLDDRSTDSSATERQLIARVEQQSRALDQILLASPDLIFICDRTGRFTYINLAGARLLGFDQSYLLGKTCSDLGFSQEIVEPFMGQQKMVLTTGQSVSGELSLPTLNGVREYEFILSPIHETTSNSNAVVCIARDITERKEAETTLRESEAKYRNLFELANDSIFIIDASNRQILNANWNAARRLGYTRQELLNHAIRDIEAPMSNDRKEAILRELQINGSVIFEHIHRRKDGSEMPVEVSSRVIEYEGQLAFQSFVRDISDRKQVESHLRLLESAILNANDAILITEATPLDEPGPKIIYVNQGFTQMTGYQAEEVIGKTPRILQGQNTNHQQLKKIRTALLNWQTVKAKLVNYRKDGSEFWVEMSIVPISNKSGQFTHWVSVQREISDRTPVEATITVENS